MNVYCKWHIVTGKLIKTAHVGAATSFQFLCVDNLTYIIQEEILVFTKFHPYPQNGSVQ